MTLPLSRSARPLGLALVAALAIPAAADASYRWGSASGFPATDAVECATTCTVAQERYANQGLADILGTPAQGVVTSWRLDGATAGGQARLRVLGGPGAGDWAPVTGSIANATRLPVRAGQLIGVDLAGASVAFVPAAFPSDADLVRIWTPAAADGAGATGGSTRQGYVGLELEIEPDADGDGFGDQTQDPDHGRPAPGDDPGGTPDPGGPGQPGDGAPAVPAAGPVVRLPGAATASRKGAVAVTVANPYRQPIGGTVRALSGRRTVASAKVQVAAGGERQVTLRLSRAARRTLTRKRRLSLRLSAALKAAGGRTRTTTRTVVVRVAKAGGGSKPSGGGGVDGTYRGSGGQVMVVSGGKVTNFNGSISLYCTRSGKQKFVTYAMVADDPDPTVGGDGRFAWEATKGYGFQKLKFDGRISGSTATGKLVVEDRSPLLGTGRIEFDYCFAGQEWTLRR